jgi:transposase
MTGAEWAVTEPALPPPAWALGKGGRPGQYCRRDVVDGIRYLVKEGIQWRAMPADLPHWRTVYGYADGWQKTGRPGTCMMSCGARSASPRAASPGRRQR